jgi:hypothetical protein
LPTTGSIYEFIGGFYGNAMAASTMISFVELPDVTADPGSVSRRTWFHNMPGISFVDFTMDPSQDLLVLLANSPAEYVVIARNCTANSWCLKIGISLRRAFKNHVYGTASFESRMFYPSID